MHLANDEKVDQWARNATPEMVSVLYPHAPPCVRQGIIKQYAIMQEWIKDPSHPMGQYVNAHMLLLRLSGLNFSIL